MCIKIKFSSPKQFLQELIFHRIHCRENSFQLLCHNLKCSVHEPSLAFVVLFYLLGIRVAFFYCSWKSKCCSRTHFQANCKFYFWKFVSFWFNKKFVILEGIKQDFRGHWDFLKNYYIQVDFSLFFFFVVFLWKIKKFDSQPWMSIIWKSSKE